MPRLIGGNTNTPTVMIAERAAEWLLDGAAGREPQRSEVGTVSVFGPGG